MRTGSRFTKRRFALAASALVTATAMVAAQGQTYTVAEVPGSPRDVSNSALITGIGANRHAFVWDGDVSTDLGTLGSFASAGYGVNSLGQVVGDSRLNEGCQSALCSHAFL